MEIKDSGERREFNTGAVRDMSDDKGRCDLLPLDIIADLIDSTIIARIYGFMRTGNPATLSDALGRFCIDHGWDYYTMSLEVSKHYAAGCKKYGERNWEKGIPVSSFVDSAVRHLLKFYRGDTDEPHDRAFVFNVLGAMWTLKHRPELNDLPIEEDKHNEDH